MAYESTHMLFRSLTDGDEENFRRYARMNNPPSTAFDEWVTYHPVCRDEWRKLGVAPEGAPLTSEEMNAQHTTSPVV